MWNIFKGPDGKYYARESKPKAPLQFVPIVHQASSKIPSLRKVAETPVNTAKDVPNWNVPLKGATIAGDFALNVLKRLALGDPSRTDTLNKINEKILANKQLTPEENKIGFEESSNRIIDMSTGMIEDKGKIDYIKSGLVDKGREADLKVYREMLQNDPSNPLIKVMQEKYAGNSDFAGKEIAEKVSDKYVVKTVNGKQVVTKEIPKPADLTQEARKYKSAEEFVNSNAKFVHETNAPDIKEFDINKVGSGQGESWLGKGVYLQEGGSFKMESYGKNKIQAGLSPDAKIFEIKETPNGEYRDSFVEYAVKNNIGNAKSLAESRIKDGLSLKNLLPRDILKNSSNAVEQLKKNGFDGLLQDGELVVYNPNVLKTKSQLTDIWNKAQEVKPVADPLIQEAKKYKSAEEFARRIGLDNTKEMGDSYVLYKGTGGDLDMGSTTGLDYIRKVSDSAKDMPKNTTSYSQSYRQASDYGKTTAYTIPKDKIMPEAEYEKLLAEMNKGGYVIKGLWRRADKFPNLIPEIQKRGYVGFKDIGTPEIVVFDKSQLTDIWNKDRIFNHFVDFEGKPQYKWQTQFKRLSEINPPKNIEDSEKLVKQSMEYANKSAETDLISKIYDDIEKAYEKQMREGTIEGGFKRTDRLENIENTVNFLTSIKNKWGPWYEIARKDDLAWNLKKITGKDIPYEKLPQKISVFRGGTVAGGGHDIFTLDKSVAEKFGKVSEFKIDKDLIPIAHNNPFLNEFEITLPISKLLPIK